MKILSDKRKILLKRKKSSFKTQGFSCKNEPVISIFEAIVHYPFFRDEYMLNKCEDSRWFVVELCENIRAHKVELANYELFSSNFHEVRISLASSYPAKEWDLFGLFEAEDERGVQVQSITN